MTLRLLARHSMWVGSIVLAGMASVLPRAAQAAPAQLYNKTIHVSWTSNVVDRDESGQTANKSYAVSHVIYVSSAGRLFERGSRSRGKGHKQSENAPGSTTNHAGEANNVRFAGNKLVGQTAFAQGARQFVVSFDSGFSSCTVAVTMGREAGGFKRKGLDDRIHTLVSITSSGESCSISDGNALEN